MKKTLRRKRSKRRQVRSVVRRKTGFRSIMRKSANLIIIAILVWSGCDKSTDPSSPTSGTITVSSRVVNFQSTGFSFTRGSVIVFPNPQGLLPDLMVLVQIDERGSIIGVFFSPPGPPRPTFRLLGQFSTLDTAQTYYQALSQILDTAYADLAIPARSGQIWAVKTRENKYAKILIRNTVAFADSSTSSAPTPYGEATFDWTFQPNGTRQF